MKVQWIAIIGMLLLTVQVSAQDSTLKTPKEKMSYAIGAQVAASIKSQGIDPDPDLVGKGFKDAFTGAKLLLTDEELRVTLTALQQEVSGRMAAEANKAAAENKVKGDAFLAANTKKEGVVTLPSGLQYKILKAGTGKKPTDTDTVLCNYKGTLIDGTVFDSSIESGKPAMFPLNGVIPGFSEPLKLMPVGSKWEVYIPSNLGYGERGAGNVIGPNSVLIFELELVSIQEKP